MQEQKSDSCSCENTVFTPIPETFTVGITPLCVSSAASGRRRPAFELLTEGRRFVKGPTRRLRRNGFRFAGRSSFHSINAVSENAVDGHVARWRKAGTAYA